MTAAVGFGLDSGVGIAPVVFSVVTAVATSIVDSVFWAMDGTVCSEKERFMGSSFSSRSMGSELSWPVGSADDNGGNFDGDEVASSVVFASSTLCSLTIIVGGSTGDFAGVGEGESSPSSLSPSSPSSPSLPSSLPSSPS